MADTIYYTKLETDYVVQQAKKQFSNIYGNAKPLAPGDPTPVAGWYKPTVSSGSPGTNYPNAGNLKAIEDYDTVFYFNGSIWTKVENKIVQLPTVHTIVPTDIVNPVDGKAVSTYTEKTLASMADKSTNIVNAQDFVGGLYVTSSSTQKVNFSAASAWISVKISSGFVVGQQYFLQGISDYSGSNEVLIFSDSSNTFISSILKSNFNGVFTVPTGTTNIYVRIANETGIGDTPTNNVYTTLTQIKPGTTQTPFTGFDRFYIDALKVPNFQQTVSANEDLSLVKSLFVKSTNIVNYLNFVGQTFAVSASTQKINGTAATNWISVKLTTGFVPGQEYFLQGIGGYSTAIPCIIFSDSSNTHISTLLRSDFIGKFTVPVGTANIYVRIANELGIGNTPTNNAYIHSVQIKLGNVETDFEAYGQYFLPASKIIGLENGGVITEDGLDTFVELTPFTGSYTNTLITHTIAIVYERLKENIYAGHSLQYQRLDFPDVPNPKGAFEGGQVVRYAGAQIYTYDKESNIMIPTGGTLIITPESEFVMNQGGWMGGYHGNEVFSKVYFLVNGKPINIDGGVIGSSFTATGIIPCRTFSYVVLSNLVANTTTFPKVNVFARKKKSDFIGGGYEVNTKIKALQAFNGMVYTGIVCVSKLYTDITSDNGEYFRNPTGGDTFLIDNNDMARTLTYGGLKYECEVTNNILGTRDNSAVIRLWDRVSDTKYYRQLPTLTMSVGETLETTTKVTIKNIE